MRGVHPTKWTDLSKAASRLASRLREAASGGASREPWRAHYVMERDLELQSDASSDNLAQAFISGMMDFNPSQLADLLNNNTTPVAGLGSGRGFTEEMAASMQAQFRPIATQTSSADRARREAHRRAAAGTPARSSPTDVISHQD